MGVESTTILLSECRRCEHYEREKLHEEGHEGKIVVMCKYYMDKGREPYTVIWVATYGNGEIIAVECPKSK